MERNRNLRDAVLKEHVLKQVKAFVVSNRMILPALERPRGRNVLGSYLLRLHCPEIAAVAKPGQFIMVRCGEGTTLPRPFSIHGVVNEDIELLFAILEGGKGTRWLSQRQNTDEIELFGPLGNGFSISPSSKNLLLVAGGIGIAPLVHLAQEAVKKGRSVTLFAGAATASQLYPRNLLPQGIKLVTATEDGSMGKKGRVTELIPEFIDWAEQVFACGPVPMYKDMFRQSRELLKGKPTQISMESVMGCGRGVCYGCGIKTKSGIKEVCTDGPVFELDEVLWDEVDV